jgi:predicted nucleotidyltransferase
MVDLQEILDVRDQIVRAFAPQSVILFGSYAAGTARSESDVDILVIMPFQGSPIRQAVNILRGIRHRFSLDLLVRTPEYVERRKELGDPFILNILEQGKVLHEAADARMG